MNGASHVTLNPLIEVQLMRIIQEALTNARKHARASQVWMTLDRQRQWFRVTIEDNGQGFDMDAVLCSRNRHSFGITTMRERAEAIGGELDIGTLVGAGTRVSVKVPLEMGKDS